MRVSRTKWLMALVAVACLTTAVSLPAQQGGQGRGGFGGGFGGGGFGGGAFGGGALALLQREEVREELELLEDQTKQLTELREKSTAKMRELFTNARPGGDAGNAGADRREEMRETFRKFGEETQAQVDKILLPHQSKRLKQLETQSRMRGGGVMGALGGDVAKQLGVSEDQQEKLRDKARELEAELRKKTNELRKQAQDQLLASLTAEQRAQFKELIGEPFEFKDDGGPGGPGGFGGFGGGGPGGAGGQGGGRRGAGGRPQNN